MQWIVEGADAKTGKEVTIKIEAATEEDAADTARLRGVFPSNIEADKSHPKDKVSQLRKNASSVDNFGSIISGMGWLCILLGIIGIIIMGASSVVAGPGDTDTVVLLPVVLSISPFITGLFLLALGSFLRLSASVARELEDRR